MSGELGHTCEVASVCFSGVDSLDEQVVCVSRNRRQEAYSGRIDGGVSEVSVVEYHKVTKNKKDTCQCPFSINRKGI